MGLKGFIHRATAPAADNGWQQTPEDEHTYSQQPQQAPAAPPAQRPTPAYRPGKQARPLPRVKRRMTWYAVLALIAISLLGVGVLALFAWQTWEFVNWLFPSESWLYKGLAVVNFDVFSTVWLCLELFLHGRLQNGSIIAAFIAGGIDFILSIACTVIELMRQGLQLTGAQPPDQNLITAGMVVVVVALLVNLISLYALFRIQWPYIVGIVYSPADDAYLPATQVREDFYSPEMTAMPMNTDSRVNELLLTLLLNQYTQGGGSNQQLPLFQQQAAPQARTARARKAPVAQEEE